MKQYIRATLVLCLLLFLPGWTAHAQIVISQYVETSSGSHPKGIELKNVSDSPVDFASTALVVEKGANGNAPSEAFTLGQGTLDPGAVLVVGSDGDGNPLKQFMDANASTVQYFEDSSFNHNGNDAYIVKVGGTTTDVFGTPNSDPGSSWSGTGEDLDGNEATVSTENQNIELKPGITSGDTDGWTDPSTRFRVVASDASTVDDLDGFGDGTPLPVELTAFDVTTAGTTATLVWQTASETNNAGFQVQRAVQTSGGDVSTWESLGFVEGNGTTTQPHTYRFRVDALTPGQHTFRLKQVDTDGTTSLSSERTITVRTDAVLSVQGPNPMRSGQQARLTVQVDAAQSVDVALYNVLGQRVQTIFTGSATPTTPAEAMLTTDRLPSGVYFLRATGASIQATEQLTIVR